jgi:hypothetical protein
MRSHVTCKLLLIRELSGSGELAAPSYSRMQKGHRAMRSIEFIYWSSKSSSLMGRRKERKMRVPKYLCIVKHNDIVVRIIISVQTTATVRRRGWLPLLARDSALQIARHRQEPMGTRPGTRPRARTLELLVDRLTKSFVYGICAQTIGHYISL